MRGNSNLNKPRVTPQAQLAKLAPLALLLLCAVSAASVAALDFGLVVNQEAKLTNEGAGDGRFTYGPAASPWVSGPLGERFSFYLSGSAGFEYTADLGNAAESGADSGWRSPPALPELTRTELAWSGSSLHVRLGRQRFADSAALAASGLFDGLALEFSAAGSRFSLGAWYTGFLYKDTADIVITTRDREDYEKPFALDGSYFASRRAVASFAWEKPDLGPRSSLALGVLGQADLNGGDDELHSQYLSARYGLRLFSGLDLQADGVAGVRENPEWAVFFAGGLGLTWALPGAMDDHLNLRALYASPSQGERLSAFVPVSSVPRGQVFSPSLAGISILRAAYTLRPLPPLSLTAEGSYFIRTDTVTVQDNREPEKLRGEGYLLGLEVYGTALWTPLPDLALTLGGGAFFPALGDAFTGEAAVRWKAAVGLILSL
jgi:hypothetical protein